MTANEGWMIAGMMAVTFGIRYFLFALADRIRMAPWIEGALKFIKLVPPLHTKSKRMEGGATP